MCQAAVASSAHPGERPDEPCKLSGDGGVHDVGRLEAAPQMDGAVVKPAALPAQAACARHLPMAGADTTGAISSPAATLLSGPLEPCAPELERFYAFELFPKDE